MKASYDIDGVGRYVLERKLDDNTTFLRWKGTIEVRWPQVQN
jgi:hypothetical protein